MATTRSATDPQRIGWIGTGVMGAAMCARLLAAGYDVSLYTRTRAAAEPLLEGGASWRGSPAAVASDADVVISIVGYPADVREVMLGGNGVLSAARAGSVVLDMTTSEPSLAEEIHRVAAARGVDALDAPVSGGDVGARDGTLVAMVGGGEQALDRVRPVLSHLARLVVLQGGPGAGQHAKMVNQIAIASGMVGVCEALLYAYRAGLDLELVLETIGGGAAGSWSLSNYGPRMVSGDYRPGFKVAHFVKDLAIALGEARRMQLALPGLALAEQLYVALTGQGLADRGTHSLVLALARLSDAAWPAGGTPEAPSNRP